MRRTSESATHPVIFAGGADLVRVPDGRECSYYYANYHRRTTAVEVCHLIKGRPDAQRWDVSLCATCPVPDIEKANQCPNMVLHARIGKRDWRFWEKERMRIHATCTRSGKPVADPYVGCGLCHAPITFIVNEDQE